MSKMRIVLLMNNYSIQSSITCASYSTSDWDGPSSGLKDAFKICRIVS